MTLMTFGGDVSRNEAACRHESAKAARTTRLQEVLPVLGQGGAPLHCSVGADVSPLANVRTNVPAATKDVEEDALGVPDEGTFSSIHKLINLN